MEVQWYESEQQFSDPEIKMKYKVLIAGFISGALAVGLGAFATHGLNDFLIENNRVDTFQTAVSYHFYHTFGVLIIGLCCIVFKSHVLERAGILMVTGILLFSGSLYMLCFTNMIFFVWITPIGGLALAGSWILAAYGIWKSITENR